MSIVVDVTLTSGQSVSLEADLTAFGTKLGRACTESPGSWPRATLQFTRQRSGWRHEAGRRQFANRRLFDATGRHCLPGGANCFAAILGDGSVITWGNAGQGGDSSSVQDQLKNVQQIQAARWACAAILGDGSVVTWGHADCGGGGSSSAKDQLQRYNRSKHQVELLPLSFEMGLS